MNRLRVPLVGLIAAVAAFALEFAALRSGSRLALSAVYTATVLVLLTAVLMARYRRGEAGAFWFGFAVFGWGYLLLSLAPWANVDSRGWADAGPVKVELLTSRLIDWTVRLVKRRVAPEGLPGVLKFEECTERIANLTVTLGVALLGGTAAVVIRGRSSRTRAAGGPAPSRRAKWLGLAASLLVTTLALGLAAYLLTRPRVVYFPELVFDADSRVNDKTARVIANALGEMDEPSLWEVAGGRDEQAYRLVCLSWGGNDLYSIRVSRTAGGVTLRFVTLAGGTPEEPGPLADDKTYRLSEAQWTELDRLVKRAGLWDAPSPPTRAVENPAEARTALWAFEGAEPARYQVVELDGPPADGPYRGLVQFLSKLSGAPALPGSE